MFSTGCNPPECCMNVLIFANQTLKMIMGSWEQLVVVYEQCYVRCGDCSAVA